MIEVTCEGCYIQSTCMHIRHSETCPCTVCLIKMICKDICPERKEFLLDIESLNRRGNA